MMLARFMQLLEDGGSHKNAFGVGRPSSVRQVETYIKTVRSAEKRNLNTVFGVSFNSCKKKACDLDLNEKQLAAVSGFKQRRKHLCIEQQACLGFVNPYIAEHQTRCHDADAAVAKDRAPRVAVKVEADN